MSKEVVIKSNRYGMNLILDSQIPFPQLLECVARKFKESGSFFKNAKMAVCFEGRELTEKEELALTDAIMANSSVQIVSILDRPGVQEMRMKRLVDAYESSFGQNAGMTDGRNANRLSSAESAGSAETAGSTGFPAKAAEPYPAEAENDQAAADFYKGTLRSGQVLESPSSITIIGDVNPGAHIISNGNVVVIGALKGNAWAGAQGNRDCFIFALDLRPIQLQIGDLIAKSPDKDNDTRAGRKKTKTENGYTPRVAVARDGYICIEPMTKGFLE